MKVIAINGSPRTEGNTSHLIHSVFEVLEENNIQTEEIHVGKKQCQGCIGCAKCWENKDHHCVLNNDLVNESMDKMREADGIILGSPVYCADVSGQIKSFIDRVSTVSYANNGMLKRKVGASVVAARRAGGLSAFHSLNSFFTILQMIIVGSSYWNVGYGMNKGEVVKDAEGMQTMKNLGLNMSWLLKCLDASKSVIVPNTTGGAMTNFIRDDL